jgi:enoyl-CoA hydratase
VYETLEYSWEERIALVRLNRPQKLNAISPQMVRELRAVTDLIREDEGIRVVVFTGNGRAFSAGADISQLVGMSEPPEFLRFIEEIQTTYNAIEDLNRPTIAAMNGLAYGGGCELALACDLRIMAEEAGIGVPEIQIGVLPGAGGTQRLSHMLPPVIAKQLIYFGEPLSSAQALQHGLVNAVVPTEQVLDTALDWARRLAKLPPLALRSAKLLVHAGINGDLKTGIEAERLALAFLFSTADRAEGMQAFLEKRTASFQGR